MRTHVTVKGTYMLTPVGLLTPSRPTAREPETPFTPLHYSQA